MRTLIPILAIFAFIAFGVLQLIAGYIGIDHHFGKGWAIIALLCAILFRITFPITIGAFFGAMDVWHWHWVFAAIFAAPGLAFIVPGILLATTAKLMRPFSAAPVKDHGHKGVTIEGEYKDETKN